MFHSETNLANTDYRENRSMILSGLSLWEKGSPLHKSTQQVRTQGPIRHADCRQRKLADFLCTGGIIQGLISVAHQAMLRLSSVSARFSAGFIVFNAYSTATIASHSGAMLSGVI
ncbi:hypothetical protein, partial [Escherichia coli]|uniref:hypothetical protein n=2 Tax=Escherichia coli TaxID=562 RepID=UPI00207BD7A2